MASSHTRTPTTALRLLGIVIRHQWVDPGGLVAYHPRLNPWHAQNSLGAYAHTLHYHDPAPPLPLPCDSPPAD